MKILYIIPNLRKGGAERIAIDICREVNLRKEHQAILLVLSGENEYSYQTADIPIRKTSSTVQLSLLRKNKVDLRDFELAVKEFQPDIIHSHLFAAEIFSREKIYNHIKYFTHCHDNMSQFRNFSQQTFFSKKLLTEFYEKQHLLKNYLKSNNKFIAISAHTKKYFESVLPVALQPNVFQQHNAIDFKLFSTVNRKRNFDKIRIVNVGSFIPLKNQQLFIAIAEELLQRKLSVEIVLLGKGPTYEVVKEQVERKKLTGIILMPGNVERVENYYSTANMYVHTSTSEAFGLVLLEAMATGLPAVALDARGNLGLVNDNENGFMLHEQSAKVFADKIELLFTDRKLYDKLSAGAIDFARQFDIVNYVDKLLNLYAQD
ncbi:MAG: glycosyltransferase family 4 protein [Bacteroidetes bacterium]|nr:glycosyltransferase family 4 protein [Bacteroidota bacterium]